MGECIGTEAAANHSLSLFLEVLDPLSLLDPSLLSGVDGDDLTPATSHQKDALQPFRQNLQELHVWTAS